MSVERGVASSGDAAATNDIFVDFEDSETPNTVNTIIRINPNFNFYSANVLRIQLRIGGDLEHSRLIRRDNSDMNVIFPLHDDDFALKGSGTSRIGAEMSEAGGHDDIVVRKVEFGISRGTLADDATFVPLRGNYTDTIDTYVPFPSSHGHESQIFYDASSQAEITGQETSIVPSNSEGSEQERMETSADIGHGPEHSGRDDSTTRDDNMTRLDRATRPIFTQQLQPVTPTFSAQISKPTAAMSSSSPNPKDIDTTNDPGHKVNLPHEDSTLVEADIAVEAAVTIDESLRSETRNTESGIDYNAADIDDEASELAGNIPPTIFTTKGHPGNGSPAIEGETSKNLLAREDGSSTVADLPKSDAAPLPKALTEKELAQIAERKARTAAGDRLNRALLKRAGDNDDKLLNRPPDDLPKPRGVRKFGTDERLNALNHRIQNVISKQVELNRLLTGCTDRNIAVNLRTRVPAWGDDENEIDHYETQLDAAISAAKSHQRNTRARSAHHSTADQTDLGAEDAPSNASRMSGGLPASNQHVQTPTSRTGTKRGSKALEDDEDLPDIDELVPRTSNGTPSRRDESGRAGPRPLAKKASASLADLSLTDL